MEKVSDVRYTYFGSAERLILPPPPQFHSGNLRG